jgi:hypothetical protein
VGLHLPEEQRAAVDALDAELRVAAEALGAGLRAQLMELRPGLMAGEGDAAPPEAALVTLDLEREGAPDPLSLAACLAAHRAYVAARDRPDGVSLGALALVRLLVWAQRAALLGPAPKIGWLGPPARRPEVEPGQFALEARCVAQVGDRTREARAVALISAS